MFAPCVSPTHCTESFAPQHLDEMPGMVKPGLSVIIRPLTPDASGRGSLLQVLLSF